MNGPQLSIVSPVYGSATIIAPLVERIVAAVTPVTTDFEIVLVEDCSPDDSWTQIVLAAQRDPRVRGLRLSRNFGQHAAITAGLANARGKYVVVMDCDLQDDPTYIPLLLTKAHEGFDIVLTLREERRHAWHRNLAARGFTALFNLLSGRRPTDVRVGGYSLLSRKVVEAFLCIQDVQRHYLLILGWMGFKTTHIPVEHRPRHSGASTYTFRHLLRHALAGLTSQSTILLKISIGIGFAYCCTAMLGAIYLCVGYFTHGYRGGWASTIVLLLASTGLILMAIGIMGIYIGNIFDQVRPPPALSRAGAGELYHPLPITLAWILCSSPSPTIIPTKSGFTEPLPVGWTGMGRTASDCALTHSCKSCQPDPGPPPWTTTAAVMARCWITCAPPTARLWIISDWTSQLP